MGLPGMSYRISCPATKNALSPGLPVSTCDVVHFGPFPRIVSKEFSSLTREDSSADLKYLFFLSFGFRFSIILRQVIGDLDRRGNFCPPPIQNRVKVLYFLEITLFRMGFFEVFSSSHTQMKTLSENTLLV